MNDFLRPYSEPFVLVPMLAITLLLFGIVLRTLREMPLFGPGARIPAAVCITVLAVYGMDQTLVRIVLQEYAAMGTTMLVVLASLLAGTWFSLARRTRRAVRDRE